MGGEKRQDDGAHPLPQLRAYACVAGKQLLVRWQFTPWRSPRGDQQLDVNAEFERREMGRVAN